MLRQVAHKSCRLEAVETGAKTDDQRPEYRGSERADPAARVVMGWGKCSVSGCPCAGFQQTYASELCNNCGHHYRDHW